jgi:hypothetical protein
MAAEGRDQDRDPIGKMRNSNVGSHRDDVRGTTTIAVNRLDENRARLSILSGPQAALYCTASNSTSKTSVAFEGIAGGRPGAP